MTKYGKISIRPLGKGEGRIVLVLLLLVGEVAGLDIFDIGLYSLGDGGAQVGIPAEEPRREPFVDAQHVVHHEYLAVYTAARTDTDDGNRQLLGYSGCQCGRNFFEYKPEATYLFEQMGIFDELLGLGLFAGTHGISAELVD